MISGDDDDDHPKLPQPEFTLCVFVCVSIADCPLAGDSKQFSKQQTMGTTTTITTVSDKTHTL